MFCVPLPSILPQLLEKNAAALHALDSFSQHGFGDRRPQLELEIIAERPGPTTITGEAS
jgi:hypothetical protein